MDKGKHYLGGLLYARQGRRQAITLVSLNLTNSPLKSENEINLLKFTVSKREGNCI